jgi:glucan endo-1,3-beta-D-glucosidase
MRFGNTAEISFPLIKISSFYSLIALLPTMRFSLPVISACLFSLVAAQKAYLGFNSGATLDTRAAKKKADFEQEFKTAQGLVGSPGLFNSVRLYTNIQAYTDDTPIEAFQAAIDTNTTMLLGIWTSGTTTIEKELSALNKAITQYGQKFADLVIGLSVGSEDLYRVSESGIRNKAGVGQDAETMVNFIKQVRDTLSKTSLSRVPIGHVDTWSSWSNTSNSAVVDAVDFLGTDLYAYYEDDKGNVITNATSLFDSAFNATMGASKGKPVWITETGWPTTGPKFGEAEATVSNAKTYWDEIGCKLFGKTTTFWYTLRDSNPDNKAKFAITKDLSTTPIFNLTCPASSGAPAPVTTSTGSSASSTPGKSAARKVESQELMALAVVGVMVTLFNWVM